MKTDAILLILFYVFVIIFIGRIYYSERKKQKRKLNMGVDIDKVR